YVAFGAAVTSALVLFWGCSTNTDDVKSIMAFSSGSDTTPDPLSETDPGKKIKGSGAGQFALFFDSNHFCGCLILCDNSVGTGNPTVAVHQCNTFNSLDGKEVCDEFYMNTPTDGYILDNFFGSQSSGIKDYVCCTYTNGTGWFCS